jgi:predicted nuclease of restriction endonuclease-like (RecB) superfamily
MRQFYDTYRRFPELSTLLRELPWSANLHIFSKAKLPEEREFYIRAAIQNRWSVREVARQINGGLFERTIFEPPHVSSQLIRSYPQASELFRDTYFLEFLDLSLDHQEVDLHRALLKNLGQFFTELGRDFCFIGSEYLLQVGGRDFHIDRLLFHRGLNTLIAVELKVDEFQPEYLGKLEFYLEALERDIRKLHENPPIGLLLCATKDDEVVKYALNRSLSPARVAEYRTHLPEKRFLREKLHEFYQNLNPPEESQY